MNEQIDLANFQKRLAAANPNDAAEFQQLIAESLSVLRMQQNDVARLFGMSAASVNRWVQGHNAPHPTMRQMVYAQLAKRAASLLRAANRGPSRRATGLRRAAG